MFVSCMCQTESCQCQVHVRKLFRFHAIFEYCFEFVGFDAAI